MRPDRTGRDGGMERRPGGTGQDGVGKGIAILSSFLLVEKAKGFISGFMILYFDHNGPFRRLEEFPGSHPI